MGVGHGCWTRRCGHVGRPGLEMGELCLCKQLATDRRTDGQKSTTDRGVDEQKPYIYRQDRWKLTNHRLTDGRK